MKKKILILTTFLVFACVSSVLLSGFISTDIIKFGIVSEASASSGAPNRKIHKGPCRTEIRGTANTSGEIFGIPYTIPVTGVVTITFTDVERDCESGGTFNCQTVSCADFFRGSGHNPLQPPTVPPLP